MFPDGLQPVNAVQAALLSVRAPAEKTVSGNAIVTAGLSKKGAALLATSFGDLPEDLPTVSGKPADRGNVCAVFAARADALPAFAVVRSQLPDFPVDTVTQSQVSLGGRADSVSVSPGHAALVRSGDNSPTVFAVTEPGKKYAFASPDLLTAFGYGDLTPATLPGQLLSLFVLACVPSLNDRHGEPVQLGVAVARWRDWHRREPKRHQFPRPHGVARIVPAARSVGQRG